jgi:hypothetical protein
MDEKELWGDHYPAALQKALAVLRDVMVGH